MVEHVVRLSSGLRGRILAVSLFMRYSGSISLSPMVSSRRRCLSPETGAGRLIAGIVVAGFLWLVPPSLAGPIRCRVVAHRGAMSERPENTLPAFARAIELGASAIEMDVRTSKDGVLFLLHDPTLDRTTDGHGVASQLTIGELKSLDAGQSFSQQFQRERIPTLREALRVCHERIDVLLDLKESGSPYAAAVAEEVRRNGDTQRTILGVRSVQQAKEFRKLLPKTRQIGMIGTADQVDAFVQAGVDIIRLWPKWLVDRELIRQIADRSYELQINGTEGTLRETLSLLSFKPDWILVNDTGRLVSTLKQIEGRQSRFAELASLVACQDVPTVVPWVAGLDEPTFLNRDYKMLELPPELQGRARLMFNGGQGERVVLKFRKPSVVFAVFEYNSSGVWSFPDRRSPADYGWRLWRKNAYRGTSNGEVNGRPHFGSIYFGQFASGRQLANMPPWWLCLAIVSLEDAQRIPGFQLGASSPQVATPWFSYEQWATANRPVAAPAFENRKQFSQWQQEVRAKFLEKLVFRYDQPPEVQTAGKSIERERFAQQQFDVLVEGKRIFRFFRLVPSRPSHLPLPTIVCFMGHGKVDQILSEPASYQHACAARFAEQGYLVYAMENVGMEPGRDTHMELDRLLRLDGFGWYSLLFAHQRILMKHVFADSQVDTARVGVAGVSTGGLLALTAAAMEPRIAAASVQGIYGSMRVSFIQDRNRHCGCGAIPGLLPEFDLPELALLVLPRALHVSNAAKDGFSPEESVRCIDLVAPWFEAAGADRPVFTRPAGGHEFALDPALEFFHAQFVRPK